METAIVLGLVTLQRLGELLLARFNTDRLLARGGREVGARHYPLMVAMHASWLIALWWLGWGRPVSTAWLGIFIVLQALRGWVIATLGARWTTRIIVLPGAPLVAAGPYRFLSHPNYVVVTAEIAVLPLAFGLPVTALVFTALNAIMLGIRIRVEERRTRRTARWHQRGDARASTVSDQPLQSMTGNATATTWLGFLLMCLGMFMAILDVQVVATLAADDPAGSRDLAGSHELDPDRVSDRGDHPPFR